MAYSEITAAETDTDSESNQTLWDKVKDNFTYLYNCVIGTTTRWVHRAYLATDTIEVSQGSGPSGANKLVDDAGGYGFWPTIKGSGAGTEVTFSGSLASTPGTTYATRVYLAVGSAGTAYVKMRYVQATRDEPVMWMLKNLATGNYDSVCYFPEGSFKYIPFDEDLSGKDVYAIQLKNFPDILNAINAAKTTFDDSRLIPFSLGVLLGQIVLKGPDKPRYDSIIAPALHDARVKVVKAILKNKGGA